MATVKELVVEQLATDVSSVRTRVIAQLVEEEQARRVKAVLKVIGMLDEARKAGFKIKPDHVTYGSDSSVQTSGYTKPKLEELKKNQEQVTKLETALNEALDEEKPNFEKVLKLAGGGQQESSEKAAAE